MRIVLTAPKWDRRRENFCCNDATACDAAIRQIGPNRSDGREETFGNTAKGLPLGPPDHRPALHHEPHGIENFYVGQRIAFDSDDVGEFAVLDRAN